MLKHVRTFNSGLTRKLLLGFGGVLVVMLVVAALLIAFLSSHSHSLEVVLRENYDSVVYCDHMKSALDQAQVIAQASASGDSPDSPALTSAREIFEANAASQLRNCTLPGELEKSEVAVKAGRRFFETTGELRDKPIPARLAAYRKEVFPHYQQCRRLLSEISEMNLANLARVNGQVQSSLLAMRSTVVMLLLAGLAFSVVFVLVTARGMIRPLMQLTASVRQVEGGNLDSLVDVNSDDEIGQLAEAFNEMAARLREYRRMDQQKLVRSEQTTQAAIDSLPDAVAVLDVHGKIEIANRTAQVHFKLEPGADIHAIRPDWAADFLEPVLHTGKAVAPEGYRSAIQLFDDSGERFLLPRSVPLVDAQGTLLGVTLVLVEITHLRKADEFKSGLLSAASHELKTPLTSIRMAMRLLLDKRIGDLNDRQQTLLAAARLDAERLVRTVEDILTFGRVEAGRARLELADVWASQIAKRALANVESAAADRQISLLLHVSEPLPAVNADLNLVACALANLLSNAVKYAPAGSAVNLTLKAQNDAIEFAVTDEGPGIPEEYRPRIFEKFFRVPNPGGPTGAGLGLSIAAEIVHLHGGTILVASSSPMGSTFVIRLPTSCQKNNSEAGEVSQFSAE